MEGLLVKDVSQTYPTEHHQKFIALDNVTLSVHPQEYVALVGPSGSGKSTLAKVLIGLEQVTEGHIYLDDVETTHLTSKQWRKHRDKIQGVFQDSSGTLNPMLLVYRNMEEALLNLTPLTKGERKDRIDHLMEQFHLDKILLETPVRDLSGGEQRRLSLIRALSIRPKYLILDEVTAGLDLIATNDVLTTLEIYKERYQCGCLFITHDMQSAYRIADRIVQMEDGKIIRVAQRKEAVI